MEKINEPIAVLGYQTLNTRATSHTVCVNTGEVFWLYETTVSCSPLGRGEEGGLHLFLFKHKSLLPSNCS